MLTNNIGFIFYQAWSNGYSPSSEPHRETTPKKVWFVIDFTLFRLSFYRH